MTGSAKDRFKVPCIDPIHARGGKLHKRRTMSDGSTRSRCGVTIKHGMEVELSLTKILEYRMKVGVLCARCFTPGHMELLARKALQAMSEVEK